MQRERTHTDDSDSTGGQRNRGSASRSQQWRVSRHSPVRGNPVLHCVAACRVSIGAIRQRRATRVALECAAQRHCAPQLTGAARPLRASLARTHPHTEDTSVSCVVRVNPNGLCATQHSLRES